MNKHYIKPRLKVMQLVEDGFLLSSNDKETISVKKEDVVVSPDLQMSKPNSIWESMDENGVGDKQ